MEERTSSVLRAVLEIRPSWSLVAVEAVLGARVSDVSHGLTGDVGDVHMTGRRDLARHDDETGREE